MDHNTIKFSVPVDNSAEMKQILTEVYRSLTEKGYNPINQIVGYLLSEDPTYITNHNNASSIATSFFRSLSGTTCLISSPPGEASAASRGLPSFSALPSKKHPTIPASHPRTIVTLSAAMITNRQKFRICY